jgi:hypothetical protein
VDLLSPTQSRSSSPTGMPAWAMSPESADHLSESDLSEAEKGRRRYEACLEAAKQGIPPYLVEAATQCVEATEEEWLEPLCKRVRRDHSPVSP